VTPRTQSFSVPTYRNLPRASGRRRRCDEGESAVILVVGQDRVSGLPRKGARANPGRFVL
jgi:hypothetical protein